MKALLIFVVCLVLSGCYCNIQLNSKQLHSLNKIEYGFHISKIIVDSFNVDGIPVDFTIDTQVICFPYCYEYASELEYKKVYGDSVEFVDSCNFKASRTIYFNKSNSNYSWKYINQNNFEVYEVMPLEFRTECWYEIRNVCPYYYIYIYVNENGKWQITEVGDWY